MCVTTPYLAKSWERVVRIGTVRVRGRVGHCFLMAVRRLGSHARRLWVDPQYRSSVVGMVIGSMVEECSFDFLRR